jgi:hypothetical protein
MTERVKDGRFQDVDVLQHLVEAANIDQQTISRASKVMLSTAEHLEREVGTLSEWIAAEVRCKLEAAAAGHKKAVEFSIKRVAWIALGYFCFGCVGMIFGIYISARVILPAPDILQREREAEATVAELAAHGGNSILSNCPTDKGYKRCIRTEERGLDPAHYWGTSGETYRLVYGY